MGDALPAIFNPGVVLPFPPTNFLGTGRNLVDDSHGVFFAGIFIGEDGIVAKTRGNLAHPWPLLAVAVSSAAEDSDQLSTRDRPQLAQHLFQALRRVRVIDDDTE